MNSLPLLRMLLLFLWGVVGEMTEDVNINGVGANVRLDGMHLAV